MSERVITVKGEGKASAYPDTIIVTMTSGAKSADYSETMEKASAQLEQLRGALESVGFDRESLKTTDFRVNSEYENVQEKNAWKHKFVGYNCEHELLLEFDFDTELLGRTLGAISSCKADPSFNIEFSIKDKKALTEQALANAVADAAAKAKAITAAAGVTLGSIISISYGQSAVFHAMEESRVMRLNAVSAGGCSMADVKPQDITAAENVTVIWSIE